MPPFAARAMGVVEHLTPGCFAFVMATGIVAIASHVHDVPAAAAALGAINWAGYLLLLALTLTRLLVYRHTMTRDFADHLRGPGFFTTIAGTSVLGAQTLLIEKSEPIAVGLWGLTVALWLAIMYGFLVAIAVTSRKPSIERGINGGWLIMVVATQSVAVLGGALGLQLADLNILQFLCLIMFLVGGLLYIMIITLIFYRIDFFAVDPEDFGPLYWIDMGGAAISVLAGSTLLLRTGEWPLLQAYQPFLRGATLFFWSAASFWIPFLIGMTVWRYAIRRDRFRYQAGLWGMVFPLGMYSVATYNLARAEDLPFLGPLSLAFMYIALAAWLLVFVMLAATAVPRRKPQLTGLPAVKPDSLEGT